MVKKGRKKKITGLPDSDEDDAFSDDDDVGSIYSDHGRGLGRGGGVQIVGGHIGRRGQFLLVGGNGCGTSVATGRGRGRGEGGRGDSRRRKDVPDRFSTATSGSSCSGIRYKCGECPLCLCTCDAFVEMEKYSTIVTATSLGLVEQKDSRKESIEFLGANLNVNRLQLQQSSEY